MEDPKFESQKIEAITKFVGIQRHEPLSCRLRVLSVGKSKKGHSVVPEEWLGREFDNADQLHREMDQLDWRRGKPPVVYCATYGIGNHFY